MAAIQVTPEMLNQNATQLDAMKAEHDAVMEKMRILIEGLSETFKGQAAQAYLEKYNSMRGTFTQFSEMLQNYATDLRTAANSFSETDNALVGIIGRS